MEHPSEEPAPDPARRRHRRRVRRPSRHRTRRAWKRHGRTALLWSAALLTFAVASMIIDRVARSNPAPADVTAP
ncbi:MAG: hypothetical protein P3A58_06345 [Gemmatimonadota bacterium]|nr:hypothetical protein [Gemmatimonadota bacterium]